jgi:hypothetical protein
MEQHTKLHKTIAPLTRWPTEDLRSLVEAVQEMLAEREQEELAPIPVKEGREVVEVRQTKGATLRLEFVTCGKEHCHCASDRGHGPYWYAYERKGGKLTSRYIGKRL